MQRSPILDKAIQRVSIVVKDYIKMLENEKEYYRRRAMQIEGAEDTDTRIIMMNGNIPLPKRSDIRFSMDAERGIYVSKTTTGLLSIQGDDAIEIHPSACNVAHIKLASRG